MKFAKYFFITIFYIGLAFSLQSEPSCEATKLNVQGVMGNYKFQLKKLKENNFLLEYGETDPEKLRVNLHCMGQQACKKGEIKAFISENQFTFKNDKIQVSKNILRKVNVSPVSIDSSCKYIEYSMDNIFSEFMQKNHWPSKLEITLGNKKASEKIIVTIVPDNKADY